MVGIATHTGKGRKQCDTHREGKEAVQHTQGREGGSRPWKGTAGSVPPPGGPTGAGCAPIPITHSPTLEGQVPCGLQATHVLACPGMGMGMGTRFSRRALRVWPMRRFPEGLMQPRD